MVCITALRKGCVRILIQKSIAPKGRLAEIEKEIGGKKKNEIIPVLDAGHYPNGRGSLKSTWSRGGRLVYLRFCRLTQRRAVIEKR